MMKKKSDLSETKISVNYLRYCEWLNSRASWIMKQFLCIVPPLVFFISTLSHRTLLQSLTCVQLSPLPGVFKISFVPPASDLSESLNIYTP